MAKQLRETFSNRNVLGSICRYACFEIKIQREVSPGFQFIYKKSKQIEDRLRRVEKSYMRNSYDYSIYIDSDFPAICDCFIDTSPFSICSYWEEEKGKRESSM